MQSRLALVGPRIESKSCPEWPISSISVIASFAPSFDLVDVRLLVVLL